jgi:hypothetical protein
MNIVKATQNDLNDWLELALRLWTQGSAAEMRELATKAT